MFNASGHSDIKGSPCQDASSQSSAREFGWIRPRPGLLETLLIQLYIFSQQTFQAIPRRLIEFSFQLMPSSPRSHHQLNLSSAAPPGQTETRPTTLLLPSPNRSAAKQPTPKCSTRFEMLAGPIGCIDAIAGSYGAKHKQRHLNRGARSCNLTLSGGEPNGRLRAVSDSDT